MGLGHSPRIVTDGLVLCLDAANKRSYGGSGTTWTDLKGGNNGTLTNMDAANFSADNSGLLTFDGSNEYVELPGITNFLSDLEQFTVSMWVNFTSVSAYQVIYTICSQNGFGDTDGVFEFNISSSAELSFHPSRSSADKISLVTASTNTWYHLCGRRSGTTQADGFLNGVLVGSDTSLTTNNDSANNRHRIGRPNHDTRYFNGKTSGVSLYNRFLSDDEIRQNYLATKERYA